MIPVLSSAQIRELDAYTIKNGPIKSVDLMERASRAFVTEFNKIAEAGLVIYVFAGPGNNGGDALAIARILKGMGRVVEVYTVGDLRKATEDFKINCERVSELVRVVPVKEADEIPNIGKGIIIDGLFGSGLTRPVAGLYGQVITAINAAPGMVFSIDIPSGLFADRPLSTDGAIVKADVTISFQVPKLTFFQPGSEKYVGDFRTVDIGLDKEFMNTVPTNFYYTEQSDVKLPLRSRFSHKGTAGRILLASGSKGKAGASVLMARGALRAGCGLLFIHSPHQNTHILQVSVPEAMVLEDEHEEIITEVLLEIQYDSVGVGPGIGTNTLTVKALEKLLREVACPLVMDADAINILAANDHLLHLLPEQSVLTPHPGEFKRLVGSWDDDFQKLEMLRSFCMGHKVNMVLKGAFSVVCSVEGVIYFNPTGNPGMATGGSGDVLAGIIAAFAGQGMVPFEALRSAVFVHGLAGDIAAAEKGKISLIASDIVEEIPSAIVDLEKN